MNYNITLINEIISDLEKQIGRPWPESYCACKSEFVKVMRIIQNRRYTSVHYCPVV